MALRRMDLISKKFMEEWGNFFKNGKVDRSGKICVGHSKL